jgi:hypothetical protein
VCTIRRLRASSRLEPGLFQPERDGGFESRSSLGSLISCARAASAGSTATRFIENNARYVEYCGADCVGLYYTCINSYLTPESPAWGRCRPRYSAESRTEFAEDSSLEGTGFELLVRGRVRLVVGRRRQRNRTGSTKPLSMRIGELRSARTPHQGQEGKDIVLDRWAEDRPRAPFHRSRDRARYRYYEGSRSGPAVTACQHYFDCSFSRDVMR